MKQPLTIELSDERVLQIQSLQGTVEGILRTSPSLRTLDDLNLVARNFVTLHDPSVDGERWGDSQTRMALSKASILFVIEDAGTMGPRSIDPETYRRAPLRLRIADFDVQGFLHVPHGGDPMQRLNQDGHPFVALTSASVVGPDVEMAVPFLAVNRQRIALAVELPTRDPETEIEVETAVS